jgi:hypothetical protein
MTYQELQHNSVLSAKNRIACIAGKNYDKELYGDKTDSCCIQKVLFTYGLLKDVECYEIDGDNNCWTEDEFLQAIQLLDSLLI